MQRKNLAAFVMGCAFAFAPVGAWAAQISGNVAWSGLYSQSVVSSDLRYPDGTLYSDLPVMMICVDVLTALPASGPASFFTNAGGSALKGGSGDLGVAAIHWLVDQYYVTYHKNGNDQQRWAFQYALWEIGNDFNGSVASISASAGDAKPSVDAYFQGQADFENAYQAMYNALQAAVPTLHASYRSKTFTLDLVNNVDPLEQSMVAIVEKAPPAAVSVPSLSQGALGLLMLMASALGLRAMQRQKRQA